MLIESKSELLKDVIRQETGAEVEVLLDKSGLRNGLQVHFSGWTRQEGPVFGLKPSGLNRHIIDFHFGSYAKPCIKHILDTLTQERDSVAWALIQRLKKQFDVAILPLDESEKWKISPELFIRITIRGIESLHSDASIVRSTSIVMVPLIGAIAELLGLDDTIPDFAGEQEGGLKESITRRRERSRRNRLLCIAIHGSICKVCGFDPTTVYGPNGSQIIEVHHIEPLSESLTPKYYDPEVDLIPLCPNCHRAIHRRIPALTPNELQALMKII